MSTLKVDTLQTTGGAGLYPAKAWVNFNGTGTVAIRADGNVSSITDNGTGDYTASFTSSITDANYIALITVGTVANFGELQTLATGSVRFETPTRGSSISDPDPVCLGVSR